LLTGKRRRKLSFRFSLPVSLGGSRASDFSSRSGHFEAFASFFRVWLQETERILPNLLTGKRRRKPSFRFCLPVRLGGSQASVRLTGKPRGAQPHCTRIFHRATCRPAKGEFSPRLAYRYLRANPAIRAPSGCAQASASFALACDTYPQATATRMPVSASLSEPSADSNRSRPLPPATPNPSGKV